MTLEEFRNSEDCGSWDEDDGCALDYPDECPFHKKCKEDAEKDPVPA